MKKIISLLLAVFLAVSCMSMVSHAADPYITSIHAGCDRSYAIFSDGSLYMWGYGWAYTKLYASWHTGVWSNIPTEFENDIKSVDGTQNGMFYWKIKTDGSCWQGKVDEKAPKKMFDNAVKVESSCVLLTDGTLWSCSEVLGNSILATDVKDFCAYTGSQGAVIKTDNSVWLWGSFRFGGQGQNGQLVKFTDDAVDVEAGQENLFVLKSDGSLWGWGDNMYGQLGQGHDGDLDDSKAYHIMDDVASIETGIGGTSVFAIKKDGSLWAWGNGSYGVLGVGEQGGISYSQASKMYRGDVGTPTKVMDNVAAVSSYLQTLILKKDGTLWACGNNTAFAVGDGAELELSDWVNNAEDRLVPVRIFLNVETGECTEPSKFVDVQTNAYYFEPVEWAVDKGITNGTSSNTFSPDQTCTRGQIITFLWRAAGSPTPLGGMPFRDVNPNMYYAQAAAWAAENRIAEGLYFEPEAPCTREMAVEFMWKFAGSPYTGKAYFEDVNSAAVDWAVTEGITSGTSNTTFSPDQICTRGHIVTFLYRGFRN